jgi:hypothetical protein
VQIQTSISTFGERKDTSWMSSSIFGGTSEGMVVQSDFIVVKACGEEQCEFMPRQARLDAPGRYTML